MVVVDDRAAHGERPSPLGRWCGSCSPRPVSTSMPRSRCRVTIEIRNAVNTAVIGGVDLVVSVAAWSGGTRRDPGGHRAAARSRLQVSEEAVHAVRGLAAGAIDGGLSRGLAGLSGQTLVVQHRKSACSGP